MDVKKYEYAEHVFNDLTIRLEDSGYAELSAKWHAKNVCSPFARIYYITDGKGYLKTDGEITEMTAGNCYFIPADLKYDYWCDDFLRQIFFHVNVTEPSGQNFFKNVRGFAEFAVSEREAEDVLKFYRSGNLSDGIFLKAHLEAAVAHFAEAYKIRVFAEDGYSPEVREALKFIGANLSIGLKTADVASALFVSESKLRKRFKAETGVAVGKYINGAVFAKAEFLLSKTDASIGSIGDMLGFCDRFYFSRRFGQIYGETPFAYRKRMRNTNKI